MREFSVLEIETPNVDSPRMRTAGKDPLSLALIDTRNQTLRWIAACEEALGGPSMKVPQQAGIDPPQWTLGHIGWFQEYWTSRNVQRHRGEQADGSHPKLASILPEADRCYDPAGVASGARWHLHLPDLDSTRRYLVDTLETTLDLLAGADEDDDALYMYRLGLFHEDLQAEGFARLSQTLGFESGLLPRPAGLATRDPLLFPATRWRLGSEAEGFAFDNERAAHEVALPEFEIDAQAVTWAQYSEFVEDGGYDEPVHWSAEAWAWLQREGRRTPRHVDQMRQGVLQHRFGKLVRVPMAQAVMHVNSYEADAWCRWAGRRLPSEVEWEAAAHQGATRGFRWGDVCEWTASTFRPYPGFRAGPWDGYSEPHFGHAKVLRGASFATPGRLRHPKLRGFLGPERDDGFYGFRSCAA
jgi:iron(II)-dependent oxidoreductase